MTAERDDLADRVRKALPIGRPTREVAMMGGTSFMVDDRMVLAVGRDADLLVRIDPSRHDELVERRGAVAAVMGPGRPMGPGWVRVGATGLATAPQLDFWVGVALEHQAAQVAGEVEGEVEG